MTDRAEAEVRDRIAALGPWFHNMELAGVRTAPDHFLHDYPANKWARFADRLPDVAGKTVLDIGCNAGFHAIEMKRRGAARVVGMDHDDRYLDQARLAAELSGVEIELRKLSVYDVGALGERFDVVLFMGVLYHLRHPLLALDLIREHAADDWLVYQSLQRGSWREEPVPADRDFTEADLFDVPAYPKLHFIEHRYAGDPTNWWAPNAACSAAMLRSAGFRVVDRPETEVFICRAAEPAWGAAPVYPARAPAEETR